METLSGMIWVHTVFKEFQQMRNVATSRGKINEDFDLIDESLNSLPPG